MFFYFSVPPTWRRPPTDVRTLEGRGVGLDCQAQGYPTPKAVWSKAVQGRFHSSVASKQHVQEFQPIDKIMSADSYRWAALQELQICGLVVRWKLIHFSKVIHSVIVAVHNSPIYTEQDTLNLFTKLSWNWERVLTSFLIPILHTFKRERVKNPFLTWTLSLCLHYCADQMTRLIWRECWQDHTHYHHHTTSLREVEGKHVTNGDWWNWDAT